MDLSVSSRTPSVLPRDEAVLFARFFQVLSDPTRLRIVKALADHRWCVSDLAQALHMDQPAVSHQLKYLRKLGLVSWHKHGRHVYYWLSSPLLHDVLYRVLDDLVDE